MFNLNVLIVMANYSVNQSRQMYVANNGYSTASNPAVGTITKVVKTPENELYFLFKGADTMLRSDFIPLDNIKSAVAIDAAKNVVKMRKVSIELAGDLIPGQDYVLGINFKNFFSSGDASQYYKDVAVHATSDMDADDFMEKMVEELNLCFSREPGATKTTNPYLTFTAVAADSTNNTPAKLVIEEKAQEWELGTKKARRIMFDVFPGTVYDGVDDVNWAKQNSTTGQYYTEETPTTTVGNGQSIADLEWFCMGERGDQYRNVGWPYVIPTKYLADPTKEYHLIEIHYAFTDTGVNSYRTEKEITIAVPKGASSANYTAVNAVIGAINTAAGTTLITTLS